LTAIALQSAFPVWDAITHSGTRYDHGPTGLVVVPEHVAPHLLQNGGYRKATAQDIQMEVSVLEARIARLKNF
jgi:hypothetical protein